MQLTLPASLKGLTQLDRKQFEQIITVPCVNISGECIQSSHWKETLLILRGLKNVRDIEGRLKEVLFDPDVIKTKQDLLQRIPSIQEYVEQSFHFIQVTITYENFTIEQVIKAILPDDLMRDKTVNTGSGYSLVGHIAHFNLRDEVLPYKHIIAQVILDKLPNVKTVVNKLHEIDSVYRNFELEIIAGDPSTIVHCRESQATFQFDFAKVYWNPRLSTERERIIEIIRPNDLVFDVFAGVGPFVVPALMLGCTVYANDINPECFKWMNINLKKNQPKKSPRDYHTFNLDGRDFLRAIVLPGIENYQKKIPNDLEQHRSFFGNKIIILMNLPELALTFLDVLSEWLLINIADKEQWRVSIQIYCYTFSRAEDRVQDIQTRLKGILPSVTSDQIACRFVRQVAPNKDMMCVHISLFDKNQIVDHKTAMKETSSSQ